MFVFAQDDRRDFYLLQEAWQEFRNGRRRERDLGGVSFREKLNILKEGTDDALIRGFGQELPEIWHSDSVSGNLSTFAKIFRVDSYRKPSILGEKEGYVSSFPGLPASSLQYRYTMLIPAAVYKPEGYITDEEDKTTHFLWTKANLNHPFLPANCWERMGSKKINKIVNEVRNHMAEALLQPDIYAEYLTLINRLNTLIKMEGMTYGSPLELEMAATSYRIREIKKDYPQIDNQRLIPFPPSASLI